MSKYDVFIEYLIDTLRKNHNKNMYTFNNKPQFSVVKRTVINKKLALVVNITEQATADKYIHETYIWQPKQVSYFNVILGFMLNRMSRIRHDVTTIIYSDDSYIVHDNVEVPTFYLPLIVEDILSISDEMCSTREQLYNDYLHHIYFYIDNGRYDKHFLIPLSMFSRFVLPLPSFINLLNKYKINVSKLLTHMDDNDTYVYLQYTYYDYEDETHVIPLDTLELFEQNCVFNTYIDGTTIKKGPSNCTCIQLVSNQNIYVCRSFWSSLYEVVYQNHKNSDVIDTASNNEKLELLKKYFKKVGIKIETIYHSGNLSRVEIIFVINTETKQCYVTSC